jgi:hypothetical protein
MTEQELAEKVVGWLQDQHWEVYQEVSCAGAICDIVAVRGPALWAIECKLKMGLAVLGQAHEWLRHANYVSVAVPRPKRNRSAFINVLLRDYGIGCIELTERSSDQMASWGLDIRQRPASFRRRVSGRLRAVLREEHKTWAKAGNARGARFTPFQGTKRDIQRVVGQRKSLPLRELIDILDHHYATDASAKQHLTKLIEAGVIEGVAVRREQRKIFIEVAETERTAR